MIESRVVIYVKTYIIILIIIISLDVGHPKPRVFMMYENEHG